MRPSAKRLLITLLVVLHSATLLSGQLACPTTAGANNVNPCMAPAPPFTCMAKCFDVSAPDMTTQPNGECMSPAGTQTCTAAAGGLTYQCVGTARMGTCVDKSDRCPAPGCNPGMECVSGTCVTPLAAAMCSPGELLETIWRWYWAFSY